MKKQLLFTIAGLAAAGTLSAVTLLTSPRSIRDIEASPRTRNMTLIDGDKVARPASANGTIGRYQAPARVDEPTEGLIVNCPEAEDISKIGTLTEVMYEDFSLCDKGAFGRPQTLKKTWYSNPNDYEYPWMNMKSGYTHQDGWGAWDCYSAGGMMALVSEDQAHINTPMLDVSASEISVLEFKIYVDDYGDDEPDEFDKLKATLAIEAAETYNMSPTWSICQGCDRVEVETGKWQDVRFVFRGGGKYTLYNIVLECAGTMYFDDIRVSTVDLHVNIPPVRPHWDYLGESFICRWRPVAGAEKYLLNVYEDDGYGQQGPAVLEDKEVNGTEYRFEGAESGARYWYTVRAVKGEHVSLPSYAQMVWDLEAPKMAISDNITANGYHTQWDEVDAADVYNYFAYTKRVAAEDGEFVITQEKYNKLTDHDGNRTGWTIKDNEQLEYDVYRVQGGVDQQGWRGLHAAPFDDCLCVAGWWYMVGREDAGLLSPEFDLSANGGRASLDLTLYGQLTDGELNGYGQDLQTNVAIAVFAWDESIDDFRQVNLQYPEEPLKPKWAKYHFDLTGLTDRCVIGIYAVSAPGDLYIREIKLTQDRKAGAEFMDPWLWKRYISDRELDITLPESRQGQEMYHKVGATGSMQVGTDFNGNPMYEFVEGRFTGIKRVGGEDEPDAVKTVSATECGVTLNAGVVSSQSGARIYDAAGRMIANHKGAFRQTLPGKGLYIVVNANGSTKVVY